MVKNRRNFLLVTSIVLLANFASAGRDDEAAWAKLETQCQQFQKSGAGKALVGQLGGEIFSFISDDALYVFDIGGYLRDDRAKSAWKIVIDADTKKAMVENDLELRTAFGGQKYARIKILKDISNAPSRLYFATTSGGPIEDRRDPDQEIKVLNAEILTPGAVSDAFAKILTLTKADKPAKRK